MPSGDHGKDRIAELILENSEYFWTAASLRWVFILEALRNGD